MSKSTVVRGASLAASILNKIDTAIKEKGGSEDALDILDKKEGATLIDVIADGLVKAELKTRNRFPVEVDYTKSLADMVKAGGYDYVSESITAENFPIEGDGVVESELFMVYDYGWQASRWVIEKMEKMGLVPAKIEHLLALGAKYPDLQREYPIICLGSSWVSSAYNLRFRFCPRLGRWHDQRKLDLHDSPESVPSCCRVAFVRK